MKKEEIVMSNSRNSALEQTILGSKQQASTTNDQNQQPDHASATNSQITIEILPAEAATAVPEAALLPSITVLSRRLLEATENYLRNISTFQQKGIRRAEHFQSAIENNPNWIDVLAATATVLDSNSKTLANALTQIFCTECLVICEQIIQDRNGAINTIFNTKKKEFVLKDLIPTITKILNIHREFYQRRQQETRSAPSAQNTSDINDNIDTEQSEQESQRRKQESQRRIRMLMNRPRGILAANRNTLHRTQPPNHNDDSAVVNSDGLAVATGSIIGAPCAIS